MIADRELVRLHRRACTDMAARMRLPRWDQLDLALVAPLDGYTVRDLLARVVSSNLEFSAGLSGQQSPTLEPGRDPVAEVVESIRTVLTVVAGLASESGFSPTRRGQLWARIVELTVMGHDLQQAIRAGAGLDDLVVDRILSAGPAVDSIWPDLAPIEPVGSGPEVALLALTGRPVGLGLVAEDTCATGNC